MNFFLPGFARMSTLRYILCSKQRRVASSRATYTYKVFSQRAFSNASSALNEGPDAGEVPHEAKKSESCEDSNNHKTREDEKGEKGHLRVSRLLRRYSMLRPEDRLKLTEELRNATQAPVDAWQQFCARDMDKQLELFESKKKERQEQMQRLSRLREAYKPSYVRRLKQKTKRVQKTEEQAPPIVAANFTDEAQTVSLVEDIHKAEVYEEVYKRLSRRWETEGTLSDQFFDVMKQAVRQDLTDQSRPTLVNEFTDFENPYMLKREAIKRLLQERGTRNALDESLIDKWLERRPDLVKLRFCAQLPPEVVEPLAAFHGLTKYSFDKRTRLGQKVDAMYNAVASAPFGQLNKN